MCTSERKQDGLDIMTDFNAELIPLKWVFLKKNIFLMYIKDVGEFTEAYALGFQEQSVVRHFK